MSLEDLALNTKLLVAGFAGGVVHVFATGQRDPWKITASIVCGLLVANYLGATASHYLRFIMGDNLTEPGAGFVMGFAAMIVVDRVTRMLGRKLGEDPIPPSEGGNEGEAT